jgi:V8-like Glu-specific endopeptidase
MILLKGSDARKIIDLLGQLPLTNSSDGRDTLLIDLPDAVRNIIPRSNVKVTDLQQIVETTDGFGMLKDGTWPLIIVLESGAWLVRGAVLEDQLNQWAATLQTRATALHPPPPPPATPDTVPATTPPQDRQDLERVINKLGGFIDPGGLAPNQWPVCRIEFANHAPEAQGTGFLLGPSTVMTNHHVMKPVFDGNVAAADVVFRFDYRTMEDGSAGDGQTYRLAADQPDWRITDSPIDQLDYALLRIKGAPGSDPVAGKPGGPSRKYLTPKTHDFQAGENIIIIQHPNGERMKFALDRLGAVFADRLAYLTNTDYGSSGSPCFTNTWDLVALHEGFFPDLPDQPNRGIPFGLILKDPKVQANLGK